MRQSSVTYRDLLNKLQKLSQNELDQSVTMVDDNEELFGFETLIVSDQDGVLDSKHLILVQNKGESK